MRQKGETFGQTAQKVILLLAAGVLLGLSRSPKQYFRILRMARKEWRDINERALHHAIKTLYRSHLIDARDNPDSTTTLILTEKGKKKALRYQIDEIRIVPKGAWDRKWRIVIFDIPEKRKKARDAVSFALKRAGFYQLQKSVFVHPFECSDEVNFIIEFFEVRPHVRFILAEHIDNAIHLKKIFKLK